METIETQSTKDAITVVYNVFKNLCQKGANGAIK
jgi:hypothetical protein